LTRDYCGTLQVHIGSRLEICQREPQALRNIHFTHIAIASTYGIRGILANPQNGAGDFTARFREVPFS
jgi:hypothetical protein